MLLTAANLKVVARGRVFPNGNLSVGPTADDGTDPPDVVVGTAGPTGTPVRINLDRIDDGATITLTYNLRSRDISGEE